MVAPQMHLMLAPPTLPEFRHRFRYILRGTN
jgi:hypothetical protein